MAEGLIELPGLLRVLRLRAADGELDLAMVDPGHPVEAAGRLVEALGAEEDDDRAAPPDIEPEGRGDARPGGLEPPEHVVHAVLGQGRIDSDLEPPGDPFHESPRELALRAPALEEGLGLGVLRVEAAGLLHLSIASGVRPCR